jgi:tetratricopeptide (TPR) repeat protein
VLAAQVLAAAPGYPDAVMTLAAAELAQGEPAAAEARLRELAIDPRATPQQQALAEGLLGDVLDALGRAEEAYAAYLACNRRLADVYRDRFGVGQSALAYARELIEAVRTAPSGAWSATPQPDDTRADGHVFVMGFFDPESPLLESLLAGHPAVDMLERGDTLIEAIRSYAGSPHDLMRFAGASTAELERLRQAYWDRAAGAGVQAAGRVVIDRQPLNIFKLPLIARLFPEAKVLVARRDPRDVVLSAFRRRFAMSAASYQLLTLQGAADYYDAAMQLGERIDRDFPLHQLVVRHEDLVGDFHGTAGAVCRFLGLEWPSGSAGAGRLAAGDPALKDGHWRWHDRPMAAVMPTLQPWVDRFGYSSV